MYQQYYFETRIWKSSQNDNKSKYWIQKKASNEISNFNKVFRSISSIYNTLEETIRPSINIPFTSPSSKFDIKEEYSNKKLENLKKHFRNVD